MAVNEDDPLDADHARIAALYRRAAVEEPPERLDRLVRDAAHEPFEPTAPPPRVGWWHAWRIPVAFAAVAVLSVSVVIIAEREGSEPLTMQAPAPAAAPMERPAASASDGLPAPTPAPAAPPAQRSDLASGAAATAPAEPRLSARKSTIDEPPASLEQRNQSVRSSAALPQELGKQNREPDAKLPAADSASERRENTTDRPIDRPSLERSPSPAVRSAAPAEPPPPSPNLPNRPQSIGQAPERFAAPTGRTPSRPPESKIDAARAPAQAPVAAASKRQDVQQPAALAALLAELDGRPVEQWVARVLSLRAEGRRDDADAVLAELKRRYPEEPLPPELR